MHAFNPSTTEGKAGEFLAVQGQPGLLSKFQISQGYAEKLYLEKQNKTSKQKKNQKDFFKKLGIVAHLPKAHSFLFLAH